MKITRGQDPGKAAEIEAWIDRVAETWNVLALDATVCRCWARLTHRLQDDLLEDAMIAATAQVHGLTVVTRNVRDFKVFDVAVLDRYWRCEFLEDASAQRRRFGFGAANTRSGGQQARFRALLTGPFDVDHRNAAVNWVANRPRKRLSITRIHPYEPHEGAQKSARPKQSLLRLI